MASDSRRYARHVAALLHADISEWAGQEVDAPGISEAVAPDDRCWTLELTGTDGSRCRVVVQPLPPIAGSGV